MRKGEQRGVGGEKTSIPLFFFEQSDLNGGKKEKE